MSTATNEVLLSSDRSRSLASGFSGAPGVSSASADRGSRSGERRLFVGLVVFVVSIALPGKFLFYLAPFLLLAASMITVRIVAVPRLLLLYGGVLCISLLSILIDQAAGMQVNYPGLLLAIVTYAPLLLLMAQARSFQPSRALVLAVVRMCVVFLILQAALSVVQFAVTGDGDYVSGSYGLFDFLTQSKTISQVNFTFSLFCMIVFILPYLRAVRLATTAIVAGMIACAIAQSGHQTIFFMLALPATTLGASRLRAIAPAAGLVLLTIVLLVLFYPETGYIAQEWMRKVVLADDSLKREAVNSALARLMENPKNALLGLGLGQYTSRASLFAAGYQSSVPLPNALSAASQYFVADIAPLLFRYEHVGESSAIAKPYFSAISLLSELGPLLTAAFVWLVGREFLALVRTEGSANAEAEGAARYCKFFIIFLTLNCFVENYLELTQALAIPAALYVVARGRLRAIRLEMLPVGRR
jgi:hypothetical protein